MEIPYSDNRTYEHVTLTNGLSTLLISDHEADKAAAAVAVAVGQMQGTCTHEAMMRRNDLGQHTSASTLKALRAEVDGASFFYVHTTPS